jgi:ADP-ribose pyrophosphatase YjhB (NUDIX family)
MDNTEELAILIAAQDGKILLIKKGDFWIFPGGRMEKSESAGDCIVRKLSEDLPRVRLLSRLVFFDTFTGTSPDGRRIKANCYFGIVEGDIKPAAEISEAGWFFKEQLTEDKYPMSEVTSKIVQNLLRKRLLG